MKKLSIVVLAALTALLTGCLGSPEGYHPGYDPRPEQITLETAEERAKRLAVPLHIVRNGAYYEVGRKEIARVMGTIPTNLWVSHENDFDEVLGKDERLGVDVAESYLKRPQYYKEAKARALAREEGRIFKKQPAGGGDEDEDFDDDDEDFDDEDEDDEGW